MSKFIILGRPFYQDLTRRFMCSKPVPTAPKQVVEEPASRSVQPKYRPSKLQKFLLVWTKRYKTKEEIPEYVAFEVIDQTQSKARIKVANIMMVLTLLASLGAVLSGKAAAKRGESIHKINQDFHKQYEENYEKKHGSAPDAK